ncbi:PadR family transcriptional regulator [Plantactinospora solaniradicis]|uniref:PadR family transcriptional regulator n=1 Tax=Plantactinospora solaniradicis TaxID=1723736 RepID=A0ABW1K5Y6_9ACTN
MATPQISNAMLDVLALLLRAWEEKTEVHGWLIMKSLRRSGPVVYGVLDRLEDAGWITGSWEVLPARQDRPRRRFYTLTAAGAEVARQQLTAAVPVRPRFRIQPGFGLIAHPRPAR